MVIAGHQPNYLPNLAFFSKMLRADLFVITTNLKFEKREAWQRRHKIRGANGDCWLTIPVFGSDNQRLKEIRVNNQYHWNMNHARTLLHAYSRSIGKDYLTKFQELYAPTWIRLVDINTAAIFLLKDILGIATTVVLDEEVTGIKQEIYLNVCRKYGGDTVLSGLGAKAYLDQDRINILTKNNIRHTFIEKGFSNYPYSTVHYLFTYGRDWILEKIS